MPATDKHRSFRLSTPLGVDKMLFARMAGHERLGEPFRLEIAALSDDGAIKPEDMLGQPVGVECDLPAGGVRNFHGLVTDFRQLSYGEHFHEYEFTLRPWFWFLTRTSDCRVFQDLSVRDIFEQVAKDHGFTDYRFDLIGSYEKYAYCVQYRETAFNFLSRLLEHEGIYYYFEHAGRKHTMVLVDDSSKHKSAEGYDTVPYFPPAQSVKRERDHLQSWTRVNTVQPGAYAATDYDHKTPSKSLLKSLKKAQKHARADLEIFDYPADLPVAKDAEGTALQAPAGERLVKVRLQELQAGYAVAHGHGNAIGLATGTKFELKKYPRADLNHGYLVIGTRISLTQNPHETGDDDGTDAHISVEAIDLRTPYRPARTAAKPLVHGAQTATVVGKKGEDIDTDELGRIKVQFHWDRRGKSDEKSSCRVRVAQDWAGKQWGAIYLPRIGQEVIVSFLEGDPDRPIVTGSVYNGEQKPPYALPANATQSGVKTRSSKGGGEKTFNEIRLEDKKGSELLHIHAEKDLTVDVENNATWRVGLDEDSEKKGKGDAKLTIGKTAVVQIEESLDIKVAKKFVKVDAGEEITLVTGRSKLVMKKDGTITITCVKLEVDAQSLIEMKARNVKIDAKNAVEIEGKLKFAAKGMQASVEADTRLNLKSGIFSKLEGTIIDIDAKAIATLKGALTKIG